MPSQFELLPRELRDQIYSEVLPAGKTINPFEHNRNLPHIIIPGILIINRKLHAEAVAFLYATNTLILATYSRSDKERQTGMSFWRRHGPAIQHVHMDIRLKMLGGLYPDIVPASSAKVWQWEGTVLREAVFNNLQTLTLKMEKNWAFCCEELLAQCFTVGVIAMLQLLLTDLAFRHVTLQLCGKDYVWNRREGTMECQTHVGEGGESGFVKHLIIRADGILLPVIDEIGHSMCVSWSLTPQ